MKKSLHGMGSFLSTGIQTIAGVITGPAKGLIAFANWVIDGLNHLSFNFFGKKFCVHLSKIPQLAEGGVVHPAAVPGAATVQPLSSLGSFLPARSGASATTGARLLRRPPRGPRLRGARRQQPADRRGRPALPAPRRLTATEATPA